MNAAEVSRLAGGIKDGKSYLARCPVHGDRNPSLVISDGAKGVLVYCRSHDCSAQSICKALGIEVRHLFFGNDPGQVSTKFAPLTRKDLPRKTQGRITKIYNYADSSGEVIAQKVRLEPKSFLWRHRRDGQFVWEMPEAIPIYNLAAVQKARNIIICEGEKDADSLIKLGYTATTAPNGARSWHSGYADYFRGKKVIVIPDADEAGNSYAETITKDLEGIAASVQTLHLTGAKDVTEYLERYGHDSFVSLYKDQFPLGQK